MLVFQIQDWVTATLGRVQPMSLLCACAALPKTWRRLSLVRNSSDVVWVWRWIWIAEYPANCEGPGGANARSDTVTGRDRLDLLQARFHLQMPRRTRDWSQACLEFTTRNIHARAISRSRRHSFDTDTGSQAPILSILLLLCPKRRVVR